MYMWHCGAGFSGVIFALKVVTTYGVPRRTVIVKFSRITLQASNAISPSDSTVGG